jgi:hypothetical protein
LKSLVAFLLLFSCAAEAQLSLRNTLHEELPSPFQVTAQYALSTDLQDPVEPRRYEHDISLNTTYNWSPRLRLGFLADLSYFSLDNQIVETQRGYGRAQPSANFFSTYRLSTPYFNNHNVGAAYFLPLDEYSRLEGYNGVAGLGTTFVKTIFGPKLSLIQGFRASYVFNSFDKNAAGTPNRTYSVSMSPLINWSITSNISLLLGFGIRYGAFTDGNNDYAYNNSQTLSFGYKKMAFFLRRTNGGYTEDGQVYLWFIDKYRNLVDAGVSYDF